MSKSKDAYLNILVVAAQSRGKTNFITNFLKSFQEGRENFLFDINGEYKFINKAKGIYDEDDFLALVPAKRRSHKNVVFEDASGFFARGGVMPKKLKYHVSRVFHTRNINIFVYHGLGEFNKDNLKYFDYLVLFRTEETKDYIHDLYANKQYIINHWNEIQEITRGTYFNRIDKTYSEDSTRPKGYSKMNYHTKRVIRITGK